MFSIPEERGQKHETWLRDLLLVNDVEVLKPLSIQSEITFSTRKQIFY